MGLPEVSVASWGRPIPAARLKRRVIEAFLEVLYSTKKEPAMTHQEDCPVLDHVMTLLTEHGPGAMANAFTIIIMNLAMQIEREPTLKAESHQRTADRQGYDPFQRENLGVEQTKGGNQCHAERRNWLSRSTPKRISVPD